VTDRIESGDFVILEETPDGYISQYYNVTVGQIYQVRGLMGSCLVIDEDDGGSTASIWQGRFQRTESSGVSAQPAVA